MEVWRWERQGASPPQIFSSILDSSLERTVENGVDHVFGISLTWSQEPVRGERGRLAEKKKAKQYVIYSEYS